MRWTVFIVLQALIIGAIAGVFYIHQDRVITLKKPPQSIAKWYKPENKRQVWLHTMFKLRREMLALEIYSQAEDSENLSKWAAKFGKDYKKIGEMVPEWSEKIDLVELKNMQIAIEQQRFADIANHLKSMEKNCSSCHDRFRAVTAALYRAPDFTGMKVDGGIDLKTHMDDLSRQVNRIVIGFGDGKDDEAIKALGELKAGMNLLAKTCTTCHAKMPKAYPDEKTSLALATLESSLNGGTVKEKGRAIGTLAVLACAQCHGTHRIAYDLRQELATSKSWSEQFKNAH